MEIKQKLLARRLPKKSIAIIAHEDIDTTAAQMLVDRQVKGVINLRASMTGLYSHNGVETLLKAKIPVYDLQGQIKGETLEGQIQIDDTHLYRKVNEKWEIVGALKKYNMELISYLKKVGTRQFPIKFKAFAENSFHYGEKELKTFITEVNKLPSLRSLKGKDVLIVARGGDFEKDLKVIKPVLRNKNIVIIAVDGGADGLMKFGLTPNYIIGDMDSVSERALKSGAEIIVHAYPDGRAPGETRIKTMSLDYHRLTFIGTSEDVAITYAYCSGANRLYTIGTRFGMNEFLEKGRAGMGSSILTRMKVGHSLVDLKGVHHLFQTEKQNNSFVWVPLVLSIFYLSLNHRFLLLYSMFIHWLNKG
ncbi:MAG: putative cytokinetic ring protein SteA [Bacillaceae bacterium]|nr:putative cytokinetic ring protein SteA [Bacillaceae bacterium]